MFQKSFVVVVDVFFFGFVFSSLLVAMPFDDDDITVHVVKGKVIQSCDLGGVIDMDIKAQRSRRLIKLCPFTQTPRKPFFFFFSLFNIVRSLRYFSNIFRSGL